MVWLFGGAEGGRSAGGIEEGVAKWGAEGAEGLRGGICAEARAEGLGGVRLEVL